MSETGQPVNEAAPAPTTLDVPLVRHCARCGQDHEGLRFTRLANAADEWEFWSMCPLLHQPILLKVEKEPHC